MCRSRDVLFCTIATATNSLPPIVTGVLTCPLCVSLPPPPPPRLLNLHTDQNRTCRLRQSLCSHTIHVNVTKQRARACERPLGRFSTWCSGRAPVRVISSFPQSDVTRSPIAPKVCSNNDITALLPLAVIGHAAPPSVARAAKARTSRATSGKESRGSLAPRNDTSAPIPSAAPAIVWRSPASRQSGSWRFCSRSTTRQQQCTWAVRVCETETTKVRHLTLR